ncbi:uncharacterized protein LOC131652945 [Vicia villosa]|uniref:uncharacterized protein LOC131652945 n=1 Tax=Vicia villosa TaxID=3911 RepID=UPI00273B1E85|nr:uncharacterized protein LOC131652945 [Vicia villosa]
MARTIEAVKDINDSKDSWKIVVRCEHLWSVIGASNKKQLEMILVDSKLDMQLSTIELKNLTLIEIENMMQSNQRTLHEFKDMPYPDPRRERVFEFDEIDRTDISYTKAYEVLTPEFISKLRIPGLPNHKIKLKVGTPIMLMRNLDQSDELCNGTRLVVTRLTNHVIETKIMSGKNIGNIFYISRMSMSFSESLCPFKLIRRQIVFAYSFFSHGQLYVAISRVTTKSGLKILIHNDKNAPCSTTTNVVYKEVFPSLC